MRAECAPAAIGSAEARRACCAPAKERKRTHSLSGASSACLKSCTRGRGRSCEARTCVASKPARSRRASGAVRGKESHQAVFAW
eukprot:6196240-Pleurochrysis_carterae.AAC.2